MPGAVGIGLAATPSPAPFTQCPPIGADTAGCGLLLVINPNGTVTALNGSIQGPYEGVEDTLIGVQNNSAVSIPSLTLNGPGAFGFDGDGLCTASGAPAGCSFGPTGYEGPSTSFTT
ncbi:MAG TPA: hypothetical protein VE155_07050, partial [Pseudonocardiaceae bacterium]|nr:hypothetical protein [Pseudonocardiaceae bacterium]